MVKAAAGSSTFMPSLIAPGLITLSFAHNGDIEAVGIGRPRSHQQPLLRQQRRMAEQKAAVTKGRTGDLPRRHYREIVMQRQEGANLVAVFLLEDRAGDVGDA